MTSEGQGEPFKIELSDGGLSDCNRICLQQYYSLMQVPSISDWKSAWISIIGNTVEFRRLGQCFIDWATAVVGEADRELTCVTLIYHSSGPIYETSAQSTKSPGIRV